ncbi:MAG: DUF1761 domain-containing protein [Candidatus Nanoarchaeia archaeon]
MPLTYDVNWIAVIIAAVVSFIISMVWYGPLFGKKWMAYQGMKKPPKKKGMSGIFLVALIANIIWAYVIALFVNLNGVSTAAGGAVVGFWLWLGLIATFTLGSILWENKPVGLYVLNNAHNLLVTVVAGIIVAVM